MRRQRAAAAVMPSESSACLRALVSVHAVLLCSMVAAVQIDYTPPVRVTTVIGGNAGATLNAPGDGLYARLAQATQIDSCPLNDKLYFAMFDSSTSIFSALAFPPYSVAPAYSSFSSAVLAVDPDACTLYVGEYSLGNIWSVNHLTGVSTQIVTGVSWPSALAFDRRRQLVYFTAQSGLHSVSPTGAGLATLNATSLNGNRLAIDEKRDVLYIFDAGNSRILVYRLAGGGGLAAFCGAYQAWSNDDGPCAAAAFKAPKSGVVVPALDVLFVLDDYDQQLRAVLLASNETRTVAGCGPGYTSTVADGAGRGACLGSSVALAYHAAAAALFLTTSTGLIRRVDVGGSALLRLSGGNLVLNGGSIVLS